MVQIGLLCLFVVIYGLKFLLKVLMRHDVVVPTERLNNLLAVLVHNNRLAQVAASLVCQPVECDGAIVLAWVLCVNGRNLPRALSTMSPT